MMKILGLFKNLLGTPLGGAPNQGPHLTWRPWGWGIGLVSLSLCIFHAAALAKTSLPLVETKQDIHNVRYISPDGKYVYFQRGNGELLLSANFKSFSVLQNPPNTNYQLIASPAGKYLVIATVLPGHAAFDLGAMPLSFLATGTTQTYPLTPGVDPRLHLHDQWMSSFDPTTRRITFENLDNRITKFTINLHNHQHQFFRPQVVMVDEDHIIYTDLNEQGLLGILHLHRPSGKTNLVWKAEFATQSIELCWDQNQLFIGERQHLSTRTSSKIMTIDQDHLRRPDPPVTTIYQSPLLDLGHLICDLDVDQVLFIKNTSQNGRTSYEGAVVDKNTKFSSPTSSTLSSASTSAPAVPFAFPENSASPSGPSLAGQNFSIPLAPAATNSPAVSVAAPLAVGSSYWQIYQSTQQPNVHLVTDVEDATHIINFGQRPILFWQNKYYLLGQKFNPQLEEQAKL